MLSHDAARIRRVLRHRRLPARPIRRAARTGTCALPTRATRCAMRRSWPACSWTRGSCFRSRSGRRAAPTAAPSRCRSAPCATARCSRTARSSPGRARRGTADADRGRGAAHHVERPHLLADAERPHARLPRGRARTPGRPACASNRWRTGSTGSVLSHYYVPEGGDPDADIWNWHAPDGGGRALRRRDRQSRCRRSRTCATSSPRTTRPITSTTRGRPRRCSSRTAGPTTCSRPTRRSASTTARAPSTRARRSRSSCCDFGHERGQGKAADRDAHGRAPARVVRPLPDGLGQRRRHRYRGAHRRRVPAPRRRRARTRRTRWPTSPPGEVTLQFAPAAHRLRVGRRPVDRRRVRPGRPAAARA